MSVNETGPGPYLATLTVALEQESVGDGGPLRTRLVQSLAGRQHQPVVVPLRLSLALRQYPLHRKQLAVLLLFTSDVLCVQPFHAKHHTLLQIVQGLSRVQLGVELLSTRARSAFKDGSRAQRHLGAVLETETLRHGGMLAGAGRDGSVDGGGAVIRVLELGLGVIGDRIFRRPTAPLLLVPILGAVVKRPDVG
jgi:hypothetical protein